MDLSKGKLGGLSEAIADIVDDNDSGRNTQDVVSGALSARALGAQAERPDFPASPGVTIAVATKYSEAAQQLGANWRQTDAGKAILAEGHEMLIENIFEGKTAGELVRGKAEGVAIVEQYASKRLNKAMSDYKAGKTSVNAKTGAIMDAPTTFKAKIAPFQKLHDALNYASGKNAEIIGSGVLGEKFEYEGEVTSIGNIMDQLADDPVYKQFHKGWGSSGGSAGGGGGAPAQPELTNAQGGKVNFDAPKKSIGESLDEHRQSQFVHGRSDKEREMMEALEEAKREKEKEQSGPQGPSH